MAPRPTSNGGRRKRISVLTLLACGILAATAWAETPNRLGPGDDRFNGTPKPDLVSGGRGDDSLAGRGDHDRLLGARGFDRIAGGRGGDYLYGGRQADVVHGGPGNDFVRGNKGGDILTGGQGTDFLVAQGGDDHLWGATRGGPDDRDPDSLSAGGGFDVCHVGPDDFVYDCEKIVPVGGSSGG